MRNYRYSFCILRSSFFILHFVLHSSFWKPLEHPSTLRLPDYEQGEDFVEGILQFGNSKIGVYYEHALSYLTLFSSSEDVLREITARLRSNFKVA